MRNRLFPRATSTHQVRYIFTFKKPQKSCANMSDDELRQVVLADFTEVPASFVNEELHTRLAANRYLHKMHHFTWRIDITLSPPDASAVSPYDHIFTPEYLQLHAVQRHLETYVLCRSDYRTIQDFLRAGRVKPKGDYLELPSPVNPFDVSLHRIDSSHSYFVSATQKMVIAHTYGQENYGKEKYTVYLMKAKDTLGPHKILPYEKNEYSNVIVSEEEHSIPNGVKYEDIISFRECERITPTNSSSLAHHCGSIFVSKTFAKKHKEHVRKVIELQQFPEERLQSQLKH